MQIKTQGIVIREVSVGEADKMITILTQDLGVISGYVRGAKKFQNKQTAATGLLCYARFDLFEKNGRYIVDGADAIELFYGVREDVERLSLGGYFAELARYISEDGEVPEGFLRFMLNTLHLLSKGKRPLLQLKSVFELRTLSMAGFMPDLVACCDCGRFEGEGMRFYPLGGVLRCENCAEKAAAENDLPMILSPAVVAAMRHILYSEEKRLFSFTLTGEALKALNRVTERYLIVQLGRSFKTLDFFHNIYLSGLE